MRISDWSSDVCSSDLSFRLPRWLRCTNRKEGGIARQPGCAEQSADPPISKTEIGIGAAVLLVLVGDYWALSETGALSAPGDDKARRSRIDSLGVGGLLAVLLVETTEGSGVGQKRAS